MCVSLQDASLHQLVAAGPMVFAENAIPRVASQQSTISSGPYAARVFQ